MDSVPEQKVLQVRYTMTKRDMKRAVLAAWRLSGRLQLLMVFLAAWPAGLYVAVNMANSNGIGTQDLAIAAVLFVVFGSLAPVFLIVRAWLAGIVKKPGQKGFLNISPAGWAVAVVLPFILAYPLYAFSIVIEAEVLR